jgi:outer membrane murein-binding lipoprotein Lpp
MAISVSHKARWALSALAASTLLAGCSVTVEDNKPELSADKLASTVSKKLAASTGQPEPDVTCPEDLVGEVGTTARCTLTAGDGSTLGVTVEVTSVKDGKIFFDIEADDKASPAK